MTTTTNNALTRLFRVYLPGPLHTDTFTSAASLAPLSKAGLLVRLPTKHYNAGGKTGARAHAGVRMTLHPVCQTDTGRAVVGALVALFNATPETGDTGDCDLASSDLG